MRLWRLDFITFHGRKSKNNAWLSLFSNPMDRGAWRATVHGITKSWTWLKRFSTLTQHTAKYNHSYCRLKGLIYIYCLSLKIARMPTEVLAVELLPDKGTYLPVGIWNRWTGSWHLSPTCPSTPMSFVWSLVHSLTQQMFSPFHPN